MKWIVENCFIEVKLGLASPFLHLTSMYVFVHNFVSKNVLAVDFKVDINGTYMNK